MADIKVGMRLVADGTVTGVDEPIAVTELTEKGFKYSIDREINVCPRLGMRLQRHGHEHYHVNGEVKGYKADILPTVLIVSDEGSGQRTILNKDCKHIDEVLELIGCGGSTNKLAGGIDEVAAVIHRSDDEGKRFNVFVYSRLDSKVMPGLIRQLWEQHPRPMTEQETKQSLRKLN